MKLKQRVLTLLLTIAMLVTFMPALAFASSEKPMATKGLITASGDDGLPEEDYETNWWIENDNPNLKMPFGESITLTVTIEGEYSGDPSYQWYQGEYDEDDGDWNWTEINNQTSKPSEYVTDEIGYFACAVTVGTETRIRHYNVSVYDGLPYEKNDPECEDQWGVEYNDYDLTEGKVELTANLMVYDYETGDGSPYDASGKVVSYQWFDSEWIQYGEDDESAYIYYSPISGATNKTYNTSSEGSYACVVAIGNETHIGYFTVHDDSDDDDEDEDYEYEDEDGFNTILIDYGVERVIDVTDYCETEIEDVKSFQWSVGTWDDDEDDWVWTDIAGAKNATYSVNTIKDEVYKCTITSDSTEEPEEVLFRTMFDTDDYDWVANDSNATATFTANNKRELTIDYAKPDEDGEPKMNIPELGDKITVTSKGKTTVYTYQEIEIGENEFTDVWMSKDKKEVEVDFWTENGKIQLNVYPKEREYNHKQKKVYAEFDIFTEINASIKTDISSISFKPTNATIYSEDVKIIIGGKTHYDLERRGKYVSPDGEQWTDYFLDGDKLTIVKKNVTSYYTYDSKYRDEDSYGYFVNDANRNDYIYPSIENSELQPGNNTIRIWHDGKSTTFTFFLDTPEQRAQREAQRAAAAARAAKQAKYAPGKAKLSKAKKGSKKVEVTWKTIKKNVTGYNIQIVNKKTGAVVVNKNIKQTKKLAKKKTIKKIFKSGKLKKGSFVVKVRAYRTAEGENWYGAWSNNKTVKLK